MKRRGCPSVILVPDVNTSGALGDFAKLWPEAQILVSNRHYYERDYFQILQMRHWNQHIVEM